MPDSGLRAVRRAFVELRDTHRALGKYEFKWGYVTGPVLKAAYRDLAELFFTGPAAKHLSFKCIVIAKTDDPSHGSGKVGMDEGFYKAYFTLLRHRLIAGHDYNIRLDHKSGPRADAPETLMRVLNHTARREMPTPYRVQSCQSIQSHDSDLLQLADLFCGVVGWAWNGMDSICRAKPILHDLICQRLNTKTLAKKESRRDNQKFNVWHYRPLS